MGASNIGDYLPVSSSVRLRDFAVDRPGTREATLHLERLAEEVRAMLRNTTSLREHRSRASNALRSAAVRNGGKIPDELPGARRCEQLLELRTIFGGDDGRRPNWLRAPEERGADVPDMFPVAFCSACEAVRAQTRA